MKTLKLAYLYPKSLNNSGDRGNILTLKKRCEWRNIPVECEEINIGDSINTHHDLYYIGGLSGKQEDIISKELQKHKKFLQREADQMSVFLGVCAGYQLLGKYYETKNKEKIEGLDLLNIHTEHSNKRFVGNITITTDLIDPNTIVGFENHSGLTILDENIESLGNVLSGYGNNGFDKKEGARYKNVFGSYIQGPVLAKNPAFTDYLIELAIGIKPEPIDDTIENLTHESLVMKR